MIRPSVLYKYYPAHDEKRLGFLKTLLVDNQLYVGTAPGFNDPFDCRIDLRWDLSEEDSRRVLEWMHEQRGYSKAERQVRMERATRTGWHRNADNQRSIVDAMQKRFDSTGVTCFSEVRDSPLMWAHYAASHVGVCVGFDAQVLIALGARPVQYVNERVYLPPPPLSSLEQQVTNSILRKADYWSYEREWRLLTNTPLLKRIPSSYIREVVLGNKLPAETRAVVSQWIREQLPEVTILYATPDAESFRILIRAE